MRPSWNHVWMKFAHSIAERSCDPQYKVGAIVVTQDNTQVLAVGYNGDHAGGPNTIDSREPGESGFIHAEINALIKCDFNTPKEKIMYVTLSPCKMCAKAIINAGISRVVYCDEYRDTAGIELLNSYNIRVDKFDM